MPRMIHGVGGRDGMSCAHGEEEEAPILIEHALGEARRPSVLLGEPRGEGGCRIVCVKAKLDEFLPQRIREGGSWRGLAAPILVRRFPARNDITRRGVFRFHTFWEPKSHLQWDRSRGPNRA